MKKKADTTAQVISAKTTPILKYDEIVIGSNLLAILFAFNNKMPIFFTRPSRPFRFDCFDPCWDFSYLNFKNEPHKINTHKGEILAGSPKELLWEKLLFILSLAGQAPLSDLCENIRYNGQTLICSNEYSKIAEIKFETCHYFGDESCDGLISKKPVADPLYTCYDWIAFNRGGKHEIDLIETTDDFVSKIWFYPTDRIDGNSPVKDACIVSRLTEQQLLDFDYSQTMARFKMVAEMESRGMKGTFNGLSPTGTPKYYKFRTTSIHRERRAQSQSTLSSSENIKVAEENEENLIQNLPEAIQNYQKILEQI